VFETLVIAAALTARARTSVSMPAHHPAASRPRVQGYGQIFEGRWSGIDRPVIGAQTIGFNLNTMGASLIVTFTTTPPTAAAVDALERLLAWKLDFGHVDPLGTATLTSGGSGNRYPAGTKAAFDTISGHRDATATICPGAAAYALLPTIRAQVAAIS